MATAQVLPIDSKRYVKIKDFEINRNVTIKSKLPFRIKVTNIKIPSYGTATVAPIGIAIIGLNNYIL